MSLSKEEVKNYLLENIDDSSFEELKLSLIDQDALEEDIVEAYNLLQNQQEDDDEYVEEFEDDENLIDDVINNSDTDPESNELNIDEDENNDNLINEEENLDESVNDADTNESEEDNGNDGDNTEEVNEEIDDSLDKKSKLKLIIALLLIFIGILVPIVGLVMIIAGIIIGFKLKDDNNTRSLISIVVITFGFFATILSFVVNLVVFSPFYNSYIYQSNLDQIELINQKINIRNGLELNSGKSNIDGDLITFHITNIGLNNYQVNLDETSLSFNEDINCGIDYFLNYNTSVLIDENPVLYTKNEFRLTFNCVGYSDFLSNNTQNYEFESMLILNVLDINSNESLNSGKIISLPFE